MMIFIEPSVYNINSVKFVFTVIHVSEASTPSLFIEKVSLIVVVIRFVIIVVEIVGVITFAESYVILKFKALSRKFYFLTRFCYAVFFVLRGIFFCFWSAS